MLRAILLLLSLGLASGAWGTTLYDNTTTDTGDFVLYSFGPYIALGDQLHLISPGTATQAAVQMFNNGGAGTFDAELDFFDVDSPVGAELGSFDLTNIISAGGDVLTLIFNLSALTVPQDLVFTVSVNNQNPSDGNAPLDLGLDLFEPPATGASDPSFIIAASNGPTYFHLATTDENVYFQLSGTPVTVAPEPSTVALLGTGLFMIWRRFRQKQQGNRS